ncbi:MAG TPA: hypothetical protein VJ576_02200 [Rhodocyclaceae bacterium]|nr:hypothetical protein [Rhodocyclaceae bacterium]
MARQLSEGVHSLEEKIHGAVSQTAEALRAAEQKGADSYHAASEKVLERLAVAKEDMGRLRQTVVDCSQSAAKATNDFAHQRPWTTVAMAVGVGLVIGLLIKRD